MSSLCVLFAAAPYVASSCKGSDGATPAAAMAPGLDDVVYEGETNDEALAAMLDATPKARPGTAGVFDVPSEGEAFPKAIAPTFAWHQDTTAGAGGAAGGAGAGKDAGASVIQLGSGVGRGSVASVLSALLGPERVALAHGAPYNGTAYLLVFSTTHDERVLRVFTAKTTYTPDASRWANLVAAGVVTLSIQSAIFDQNLLAADGGPYGGSAVHFSVP